jgi:phospholipid/cholesterol/gamma-HCH transport system permease protein
MQTVLSTFAHFMKQLCQQVGHIVLQFCGAAGSLMLFILNGVKAIIQPPYYGRLIIKQFIDIGYYSLPVVGMTALFTGMVLALQSYTGFARFNAEGAVATVVILSITRELAPVLAGLMVAGRIGAAMAAEIGTMKVTEQIDALRTLSTNPFNYLVAPRLLAGTIMLPLLVLVADVIGVFGGYLVGVYKLGLNASTYIKQ